MPDNPLDMTGRTVIVTGGTAGLGRVIARRFLEHGAHVVVCARNPGAQRHGRAAPHRAAMRTGHRASVGRAVALCALGAAVLLAAQAGAWAHEGEDEPLPTDTGDDLRPVYEVPEGADRIIGSPDPGPDPQHSGDRGGSLQFVTLGAVAVAVGFIMWRIARSARRASHPVAADSRG